MRKYSKEEKRVVGIAMFLMWLMGFSSGLAVRASEITIEEACKKYHATDCNLVKSIAWVETRYKNTTINDEGSLSYGIMQMKCETARIVGLKYDCDQLKDPMINLRFGILYIEYQLKRYLGNIEDSIAAYNAGSAIKCKNYNPGLCFPGEFINHLYVYKVWRKYRWLKNLKPEIVPAYYNPYKKKDGLKNTLIVSKLESQTSWDYSSKSFLHLK